MCLSFWGLKNVRGDVHNKVKNRVKTI